MKLVTLSIALTLALLLAACGDASPPDGQNTPTTTDNASDHSDHDHDSHGMHDNGDGHSAANGNTDGDDDDDLPPMVVAAKTVPGRIALVSEAFELKSMDEIGPIAAEHFPKMYPAMGANVRHASRKGELHYYDYTEAGQPFKLQLVVPTTLKDLPQPAKAGAYTYVRQPAFVCVESEHHGSLDTLGESWQKLAESAAAAELTPTTTGREIYVKMADPDSDQNHVILQMGVEQTQ